MVLGATIIHLEGSMKEPLSLVFLMDMDALSIQMGITIKGK